MVVLLILVMIVSVLLFFYYSKRPSNYPPGPKPLPVIGNYHQLPDDNTNFYLAVKQLSSKYGPIIGLSLGNTLLVLVDGADNVLEALRKEEFQSRPNMLSFDVRTREKNLGLFFSNGEQWASTRKFVMRNLKGYGKNRNENLIADEIERLVDTFRDGTIKGTGVFTLSALNVIWRMLANKRLDLDDQDMKNFLNNITLYFKQGNPAGIDIVNIFPITRHFSSRFKFADKVVLETHAFLKAAIQEHREILDPNNPLDLIDHYLLEMGQKQDSKLFSEDDLITLLLDMFTAGAESTSNSIEFILMYMVLYPEVQARMQEEIDRVLNRSRQPVLDDKSLLHYSMAVITEVERINTIAPTNAVHSCTRDTTFGGHFIPKDTVISMNLRALGHDEKHWQSPEEFKPERFIKDGTFSKPPVLATFGLGQRQCVGEIFARNTIFLFVTTFFERFSIRLPPGEPRPSTLPQAGLTASPRPFNILIKSRY